MQVEFHEPESVLHKVASIGGAIMKRTSSSSGSLRSTASHLRRKLNVRENLWKSLRSEVTSSNRKPRKPKEISFNSEDPNKSDDFPVVSSSSTVQHTDETEGLSDEASVSYSISSVHTPIDEDEALPDEQPFGSDEDIVPLSSSSYHGDGQISTVPRKSQPGRRCTKASYLTITDEEYDSATFSGTCFLHLFRSKSTNTRILDMHMSDLCGMYPKDTMKFLRLHCKKNSKIPGRLSIYTFPQVVCIKKGQVISRLSDFHPRETMADKWNSGIVKEWIDHAKTLESSEVPETPAQGGPADNAAEVSTTTTPLVSKDPVEKSIAMWQQRLGSPLSSSNNGAEETESVSTKKSMASSKSVENSIALWQHRLGGP